MVIAEAIREAETEYVVYFLLDAYLHTGDRRTALKKISAEISILPVRGRNDVHSRYVMLKSALNEAAEAGDVKAATAIKEALMVFGAAVQRLESLATERSDLTIGAGMIKNEFQDAPPPA
jgi:hypothetical protein